MRPLLSRFSRAPPWYLILRHVLQPAPRSTLLQVGLLPVPHPILVRKYHSNSNTQVLLPVLAASHRLAVSRLRRLVV
jgi:hypothetical protein